MPLRWIAVVMLAFSLTLVAILALQNRTLRATNTTLARRSSELRPGQFVPTFRTKAMTGDSVTVADATDTIRDVVYIFTWTCPYCRESLPAVNALASRLSSAGTTRARLLGISLDSLARRDDPRLQLYHFPVLRFPERRYQSLYRASQVPALIVISDEGRVLFSRYGIVHQETVDSIATIVTQAELPKPPPRS